MEALVEFITRTKELLALLESGFPEENREEYIASINTLLDERDRLLKTLPDLASILEEDIKESIIETEKKLAVHMGDYLGAIKKDLQVLQLQKKNTVHYSDYGNFITGDGMFLDKKK